MPNDSLMEPLKGYQSEYKELHHRNAEEFFEQLTKKSGVDVDANRRTVEEYKNKLAEIENVNKILAKARALRAFLIIIGIIVLLVGTIVLISSITGGAVPLWAGIIVFIFCAALFAGSIVLIKLKISKKIASQEQIKIELEKQAKALLQTAWKQMAGLNALYDWGMSAKIVSKTIPLLVLDKNFDEKKFTYLHEKYGLSENTALNRSTQFCQSGSILGNPFLICKDYEQNWIQKRYEGHLTIHWTETVHTKNGTQTVHRTQTLYASLYKPAPAYSYNTYLVYGNEAAPNLIFSRKPSGATGKTEKQIDRMVASGAKKLEKKARKAVTGEGNYTKLGNDAFEVLFGGTDRNNEIEFRLLYTPLAQKNLLELIKTPQPYGDDFTIQKIKQLNFVQTNHAQRFDYNADPVMFVHYDYDTAKKSFINYNDNYFKSLYFDLAPLMCVPLYQQHKSKEFIYDREYKSNISSYEHEAIANSFDINLLKPQNSITPSILKTNLIHKEGVADSVAITAHAFRGVRHLSYVHVCGGDGRSHAVPVYWIEYLPVERVSTMAIEEKNSSRFEFNCMRSNTDFENLMSRISYGNACLYERGLFAMLTGAAITRDHVQSLNRIYADSAEGVISKPKGLTIEELIRSIHSEVEKYETAAVDTSESAASALLDDDSADTTEVAVTDADLKPQEEQTTTADDDGDDDIFD